MNWAWHQDLAPTQKLILMALADAADDHGICWPSVPTVAAKCRVSDRTVRRGMQTLVTSELMISDQRYRKDGSCSSNRYRLLLEGGDKLSPPPDTGDSTPCHGCQAPPDTGVIPRTTIRTQKESPQPPEVETLTAVSTSAESGGGKLLDLEYHKDLLPAERTQAEQMIQAITDPLVAQQILDEWAGIISAGVIRASRLGCLRGLIKRAQEGTFTQERGFSIAKARSTKRRIMAAHEASKAKLPLPEDSESNNKLSQRVAEIANRAKQRQ